MHPALPIFIVFIPTPEHHQDRSTHKNDRYTNKNVAAVLGVFHDHFQEMPLDHKIDCSARKCLKLIPQS